MILYVDDINTAVRVMGESAIRVVTEQDLVDDEFYS